MLLLLLLLRLLLLLLLAFSSGQRNDHVLFCKRPRRKQSAIAHDLGPSCKVERRPLTTPMSVDRKHKQTSTCSPVQLWGLNSQGEERNNQSEGQVMLVSKEFNPARLELHLAQA